MADNTSIEWTDATWPVVTGCDHVSPGCGLPRWQGDLPGGCYAAKLTSGRLKHLPAYEGLAENGRFNGKVRLLPERLTWPLKWKKSRKIFVSDMADLFHDAVPDDYLARVFAVMAATPDHTFQVLTKRHGRMRSLLSRGQLGTEGFPDMVEEAMAEFTHAGLDRWPLPNVWLGVSVENQHWADIRIPALLETPAAVHWISAEPLLGPVDLKPYVRHQCDCPPGGHRRRSEYGPRLGWVVAGGESGPGARPAHPDWFRQLRDQCQAAGVPYLFKQHGAWAPYGDGTPTPAGVRGALTLVSPDGRTHSPRIGALAPAGSVLMARYGKGRAGRVLDGRIWDEFPAVTA